VAGKAKNFTILFILLFGAYAAVAWAVTPPLPAHPSQYVVDLAGVLDAGTQARLNAMLRDLETGTTAQVVVLTLNSLEGEPIDSFSHQTAVKWGIGQKGKDNGVLITVAVKDRKYRLEVGYGLEAILPDSLVGSIGRESLAPHFKKGDFAGGIVAAVTGIAKIISRGQAGGQAGTVTGGEPGDSAAPKAGTPSANIPGLVVALAFIIIMLTLVVLMARRIFRTIKRGGGGFWFSGGSSDSGWSSGGSDSGGFSSGGGDFGGGGSSGDW